MTTGKTPAQKRNKLIFAVALGMAAGFLGATAFMEFAETDIMGTLDASREIAGLVAVIYIATGLSVGVGLVAPKAGARFLNVEDADELREQRKMLGYSFVAMLALGALMLVAVFAAPMGPIPPATAIAAIAGLVGLTIWMGMAQRRHIDELMRELSREATTLAFYLTVLIGGGWAMLAHTGFVDGPAPLDWLTLFAGTILAASFICAGRRGMLEMR